MDNIAIVAFVVHEVFVFMNDKSLLFFGGGDLKFVNSF